MKASILMPVYNAEKYLAESVQSILNQTFKDFELIIINDGSTDSSLEIAKNINDARINILNLEKNIGDALAMNKGIGKASGEYIFRMDSDDIASPTKIEKQIKYMDEHPDCVVCGTWIQSFGRQNTLYDYASESANIKSNLLFFNCLAHPSVGIRKKFLNDTGLLYTKEFPHAEDFDLLTKISTIADIHNIPEVLLKYRTHQEQIGSKFRAEQIQSAYTIMKRQITNFLGVLTLNQEKACQGILNILIVKKNTAEEEKLVDQLFQDIIECNNKKNTFDKTALNYSIDYLKRKAIK